MGLMPAGSSLLRDRLAPAQGLQEGHGSWENSLEFLNVTAAHGVSLTASSKVAALPPPPHYGLP